jgi:hypothetical protein
LEILASGVLQVSGVWLPRTSEVPCSRRRHATALP